MPSLRINFDNSRAQSLVGYFEVPDVGEPLGTAIFAHCFTCSKDLKAAVGIARALASHGIATLRFDFTGLGQSEGSFSETGFSTNLADLEAAAAWLEREAGAPQLLVGHSLGGTAVLAVAERLPSVRAVATIGSPAEPDHATHLLASVRSEVEASGVAKVTLAGRTFTITRQMYEDLEGSRIRRCIRELGRALLILHSPVDDTVDVEQASKIYAAAEHPKSFVALDDADHLLRSQRDYEFAGDIIAAWARRYVGNPSAEKTD